MLLTLVLWPTEDVFCMKGIYSLLYTILKLLHHKGVRKLDSRYTMRDQPGCFSLRQVESQIPSARLRLLESWLVPPWTTFGLLVIRYKQKALAPPGN